MLFRSDAKIRAHLREEVRGVVKELGITTVYVTHDQEEALSMSDRVAVMDGGRFRQVGRPMDVYARPAGAFVANFIGTSNRLDGRVVDGTVRIDGLAVPMNAADSIDGECVVCLRPEHVRLASLSPGAGVWARAEIDSFAFLGQSVRVTARLADGARLLADLPTGQWLDLGLRPGDAVLWSVDPDAVLVFPRTDAGTATA